jgi:hypothetical protein
MTDEHTLFQRFISNILLCTFFTTIALGNPALASSFDDGKTLGNSTNSSIATGISDGSSLSLLPKFGATGSTTLQSNYPGNGRDGIDSITSLINKGSHLQDDPCATGDLPCQSRQFAKDKYQNAMDQGYKATARTMRTTEQLRDPNDVLGLNNSPSEGMKTLCTELTVDVPIEDSVNRCATGSFYDFKTATTTDAIPVGFTAPMCGNNETLYRDFFYRNGYSKEVFPTNRYDL